MCLLYVVLLVLKLNEEKIDVSQYKYSQIIGSLLQLANYTRQDIAYVVGILGRYTHNQCFTL